MKLMGVVVMLFAFAQASNAMEFEVNTLYTRWWTGYM